MASINSYTTKSGKVKYEVRGYAGINKGTGKQNNYHKAGFDYAKDARAWGRAKENELINDKQHNSYRPNMLLATWLREWVKKYKVNVKEGSMIVYRYQIEHYLIPDIGNYRLYEYTPIEHQKYILGLLNHGGKDGTPLSRNSVNVINATLHAALGKAARLGIIKNNPTVGVEFPRQGSQPKLLRYWTVDQADEFLDAVKHHKEPNKIWYPFFLLLIDTGLRKGEAMALQWDDFDLGANTVSVNKTRLYRKEKGKYKSNIILDDPKSKASVRTVALTPRLVSALWALNRIYFNNRPTIAHGRSMFPGGSEFVFRYTSKRSFGSVIRESSVNHAFTRLCELVDLPNITVHDLRHTHAVALREAGVSLDDIRGVLGHSSVQTTEIYAEITPKVVENASEKYIKYLNQHEKK
ncbi:tyrosine-type recombinase/integrase [Lacticaseibacillus zhaodongensis]|uniref:tyrosine-type recombinase/integrase n=1 Tax=Lacticaseibacillus zhaodongensis TaxID=2668065 RepID=UPI0012D32715|nr:site-specific integrase [Lacticaseibacillus zhaodongensis]